MVENIFAELKDKMAEQKLKARLTELDKQLVRCEKALSLSIQLNLEQEDELSQYKFMEAGYSEGE